MLVQGCLLRSGKEEQDTIESNLGASAEHEDAIFGNGAVAAVQMAKAPRGLGTGD